MGLAVFHESRSAIQASENRIEASKVLLLASSSLAYWTLGLEYAKELENSILNQQDQLLMPIEEKLSLRSHDMPLYPRRVKQSDHIAEPLLEQLIPVRQDVDMLTP